MSSRALGTRTIRAVGVGELSLAIAAARGIDRAGVGRALATALETGLDLVDVASEDDSERLVGDTIRSMRLRDKVVAAARIPAIRARGGAPTRETLVDRLPARYVVAQVEAVLRSTKLDALPLAQLELRASWRSSPAWPELVGTCARLVREGKVLDWGALVARIEDDTPELVKEPWLASISVPFSICERAADKVLAAAATAHLPPPPEEAPPAPVAIDPMLVIQAGLPAELVLAAAAASDPKAAAAAKAPPKSARETPIAVLARRPLAGGALAGAIGPGVKLKPRDDRSDISPAELERVAVAATKLARFVKQVPPVARSCDAAKLQLERNTRPAHVEVMTLAELSLRYVVSRGAIALPRLHRHEHVIEAFAAASLPDLDANLVENLDI